MSVREYYAQKPTLFQTVKESYDSLAKEHDVMVLEGAGSPGEVNLKANDIVNMAMARHAGSKVLIAGDIDRGGIYASLFGTVQTFEKWERDLLMGFLINRFRGDASLLAPAHEYLLRGTGKPVLGVIPYVQNLSVPDEDSVALDVWQQSHQKDAAIDIAMIRLPHTSNFTDVAPLALEPDVSVRVVSQAQEMKTPDLIIIPGSKNVFHDMQFLSESGLAVAIKEAHHKGIRIIGICGGLQLCGETIVDTHKVESIETEVQGLGLLPLTTTMQKRKLLTKQEAVSAPLGETISGYEIHHGKTEYGSCPVLFRSNSDIPLGFGTDTIWTTYLHGLFDADRFRWKLIELLRTEKGLPKLAEERPVYDTDAEINRLADVVRESVDLHTIYREMGIR